MEALYQFLHKNGIAVAFGLALLAAVTSTIMISVNSVSYSQAFESAGKLPTVENISDVEEKNELQRKEAKNIHLESQKSGVGTLIVWGLILAFLGALSALIFPLVKSLDNPKSIFKFALSLAGVVIIFIIAYFVADSQVVGTDPEDYTGGEAQFSGAVVGTIFVFVGLALAGMIGGEVYRLVKERN